MTRWTPEKEATVRKMRGKCDWLPSLGAKVISGQSHGRAPGSPKHSVVESGSIAAWTTTLHVPEDPDSSTKLFRCPRDCSLRLPLTLVYSHSDRLKASTKHTLILSIRETGLSCPLSKQRLLSAQHCMAKFCQCRGKLMPFSARHAASCEDCSIQQNI